MMNKKRLGSLLAAAALVLTGTAVYGLWNTDKTASIVSLDVNPSIEIHVDEDGDVLRTESLNSDGEKVLEGMKLKGADADTAVNAIVGSLLRHGYIDDVANSILLTVEDENTVRGEKLKQELTEEIHEILSATAINASILSQNMKETNLAEQENISEGKATLVENIVDANETYKAEELADLSVNELNLILSNSKNKVENVEATGKAADAAYIGREKAKETALSHAGVKETDVRELDVEMDYEYKVMVYEVEFSSAEYEYDYVIDAKSGEVLHSHREYDDDYMATVVNEKESATTEKQKETTKTTSEKEKETSKTTTSQNKTETSKNDSVKDIGKEKAKSIALSHAGVKESETARLRVEREYDDGRLEYQVEFHVGNKEYDYEILGFSGKILDYDVDIEDDRPVSAKVDNTEEKAEETTKKQGETTTIKNEIENQEATDIGREKAKSIALSHAGVKESEVSRLKVEREYDDGRLEYQVEFYVGNKEYDYEINGDNGKILDYDVEVEDRD